MFDNIIGSRIEETYKNYLEGIQKILIPKKLFEYSR